MIWYKGKFLQLKLKATSHFGPQVIGRGSKQVDVTWLTYVYTRGSIKWADIISKEQRGGKGTRGMD